MTMDVMPNWTEKQCKDFIKDNSLTTLTYKEKKDVFFTVAKKLRDNFFETYVGLTKWHEDSHAFAKKHGYIRSIYGAIRRLPELTVQNDTSELGKKREANLLNISLNSPIQNMESVVMHRVMVALHDFIQENNLKSFIFGNIHDAIEMYVHRSEIKIVRDKVIDLAEFAHEEYEGIPIVFEGNIADPLKGQVWDCGKDWEAA
jgi:DNA polymerase I-like protein with 3'-5' exonuclease and polymerase domains